MNRPHRPGQIPERFLAVRRASFPVLAAASRRFQDDGERLGHSANQSGR